jgi:hypothetical protein
MLSSISSSCGTGVILRGRPGLISSPPAKDWERLESTTEGKESSLDIRNGEAPMFESSNVELWGVEWRLLQIVVERANFRLQLNYIVSELATIQIV